MAYNSCDGIHKITSHAETDESDDGRYCVQKSGVNNYTHDLLQRTDASMSRRKCVLHV